MRPFFALAHICSQLFSSYIDVFVALRDQSELPIDDEFYLWKATDWLDFLHGKKPFSEPLVCGVERLRRRSNATRMDIANLMVDQFSRMRERRANHILICDQLYPRWLREIPEPPIGLFVLGQPELLKQKFVSIIGSRRPSAKVLSMSYNVAVSLCSEDLTIVSGGAMGCDAGVHWGALKRSHCGASVIVFANALDDVGPKVNLGLFRKTLDCGGLWLSERLWGSKTRPFHFPALKLNCR